RQGGRSGASLLPSYMLALSVCGWWFFFPFPGYDPLWL
ncbi:Os09g0572301, partial [Oryza sativa Japonica Group]